MGASRNEQEAFWRGGFGTEYIKRNQSDGLLKNNIQFFAKILAHTTGIERVIEFGANIGLNLQALRCLIPQLEATAVEINEAAVFELKKQAWIEAHHNAIMDFDPKITYDLAFVKGVLIHVNPDDLNAVYEKLYQSSHRYILLAEYYNPKPVSIDYRGHQNKLFKRDFCGEMLDRFPTLKLVDYGFCYHRDNNFPQDDTTWFLLEKSGRNSPHYQSNNF